jgi:hypothetical protein
MGNITIYVTERGEIRITDEELQQAGIRTNILPRWTHEGEWRSGFVQFLPKKRADILQDFLELFARDFP